MPGTGEAGVSEARRDVLLCGDSMRAIAALGVLGYHVVAQVHGNYEGPGMPEVLGRALGTLDGALFIFFCLSGFLIAGPYVRSLVLGEPRPLNGPFFIRRAARLLPALWLFAALTLIVRGARGSSAGEVIAVFAAAQVYWPSAFDEAIVQAWSIDVEVFFYATVPLVALLLARPVSRLATPERRAAAIVAGCAVVMVASFALRLWAHDAGRSVVFDSGPALLYAFMPGVALAALAPVLRHRVRGSRLVKSLALVAAAVAVAGLAGEFMLDTYRPRVLLWVAIGCGAMCSAILWEWASCGPPRWLRSRWLVWTGERSYGVYLCHVLVLHVLGGAANDMPSATLAVLFLGATSVPCCLLVAAASWRLLERPCIEWGRRIGGARPAAPAEVAPVAYAGR